MEKQCAKCLYTLSIQNFSKKKQNLDGLQEKCKKCCKQYYEENKNKIKPLIDKYRKDNKEYFDKYREINKEYFNKYRKVNNKKNKQNKKIYYQNNKENIKRLAKEYYKNNTDKVKKLMNKYKINNSEKINFINNKYRKNRRLIDKKFKLTSNIRTLIRNSIHSKRYSKNSKTQEILGCSYDEFKKYIESKWEVWMNWDNYGNPKDGVFEPNKTWDIDHIIPTSSALTEEELIKLNHHTNLQPLCSYVNRWVKKHK